ncbi:CGFS type glutaredoxin 6 [Volvox carteri f. nagariensis]|uniref:CGFS type glutaredoxin 6 n=1 Tax=Volvox carteri f. nagariensis TaxID=3068 RepID=D8TQD1_VOLCA|nr:CGFS type glutaredoxin 6 [Volvox carteri f. nagariensis]EFJ50384.1 CGFS type glutaredoxin 6 [Volvox carteri f. nagariensis]|eukprot:XP_002948509.1 CGFS type glutaredoxin 6 [Volvox carteri f. nagariensis]
MQCLPQKLMEARPAARMPKGVVAPFTSLNRIHTRHAIVLEAAMRDTKAVAVMDKGELNQFPGSAGVYAVFDKAGVLQYIGLTRKVSASVAAHMQELPDLTASIKYDIVEDASREGLTSAWKSWVEEAVTETGNIPPGNMPGETKWQSRSVARATKPEIRLTAGKPIQGITIEGLIDRIVKENAVVAFVKGTRQQPQCGFSARMLSILTTLKADFEVVNVLDEYHNPGLREAIKSYSQWPTIPQLYISGEFVGGADIAEQMVNTGELQTMLRQALQKA